MVQKIIQIIISTLLELLPKDKVKFAVDKALDKIEDAVKESKNPFDDMIVLPFIKKIIREPFGIEDNDEPDKVAESGTE